MHCIPKEVNCLTEEIFCVPAGRDNRPRSIYQYSNMATRLSGQTSIFAVIFFVFKSLLGIERQKKLRKFTFFTRKPRSHVRILIYRTSPILESEIVNSTAPHHFRGKN